MTLAAMCLSLTGCGGQSWLPEGRELENMVLMRTLGAVSYTHLDVYKRQAGDHAGHAGGGKAGITAHRPGGRRKPSEWDSHIAGG